jgi:transcriptional regulator
MYTPALFKITDEETINAFLKKYAFVTIVGNAGAGIEAAHIPVSLHIETKELSFHIAAANPIRKAFDHDSRVLVIFQGPHGYISPKWYTQPNVPTWNYASIHVYGDVRQITSPETMLSDLKTLVSAYDTVSFSRELFVGDNLKMVDTFMPAILGYRISIREIQAKFKLGQNRDPESTKNVISELKASPIDTDRDLGDFMQDYYDHT